MKEMGVGAVTYMPIRNKDKQLRQLRSLCEQYRIFHISGKDINSPRQSFLIKAMENSMFA